MNADDVRCLLAQHRKDLDRLGVTSLRLFGSVARGEATERSDVDLILETDHPISYFDLDEISELLERILHRPVDLATPGAISPWLRRAIEEDIVDVA